MFSSSQKYDCFPFWRVAVLVGGGIIFCAYLINLSYFNETGKFCELFGTDCSSVIHSAYGSIWGISTACLGLSYFIFHLSLLIGLKRIPSMTPEMISLLLNLNRKGTFPRIPFRLSSNPGQIFFRKKTPSFHTSESKGFYLFLWLQEYHLKKKRC